jgi:hypothetical protein
MGFRVEIDQDTSMLIHVLRSKPEDIFGKPYAGYLFFLAGNYDKEILTWFTKNLLALDSLTGESVAFAIFAHSFRFKFRVSGMNPSITDRVLPMTHNVSLSDLKASSSVTKLVKSRKWKSGVVIDGDEINAITYAVDDIARGFGVLDELPCILVLDAIPKREFQVIRLDGMDTNLLFPLLRRTCQRLLNEPKYNVFMSDISRVVQLQKKIDSVQEKIDRIGIECEGEAAICAPFIEKAGEMLRNMRLSMMAGSIRRTIASIPKKKWVDSIIERYKFNDFLVAIKENHELLSAYANTIGRLYLYTSKYPWPLEEPWRSKYTVIYTKYVYVLLKDAPSEPDLDSPEQCKQFRDKLIYQQSILIDKIMSILPDGIFNIESIADELHETKQGILLEAKTIVSKLYEDEQPSLIKCLLEEVEKDRRVVAKRCMIENVKLFATSWLSPENIIKFGKVLSTP